MKKEYLILIGIILILCAYLFIHKGNRDHYSLPEIPQINIENVTGIIIEKNDASLFFSKNEKEWTLTDKLYPADNYLIDNMLAIFKVFKLSTVVSQKENLARYELDKKQGLQIKLIEKENTVFELTIGKTAPTLNHTFVKVSGDKNIYHAVGSFRSHFDKGIDDYRDKNVLPFKQASIKQLSLKKETLSKTLVSTQTQNDKEQNITTWSFEGNTPADQKIVSALLSDLENLACEKYLDISIETLKKSTKPLCSIQLENKTIHGLTLYQNSTNKNLIGISSMNKYVFAINQNTGKQIISNIDELLGINKIQKKL